MLSSKLPPYEALDLSLDLVRMKNSHGLGVQRKSCKNNRNIRTKNKMKESRHWQSSPQNLSLPLSYHLSKQSICLLIYKVRLHYQACGAQTIVRAKLFPKKLLLTLGKIAAMNQRTHMPKLGRRGETITTRIVPIPLPGPCCCVPLWMRM